MEVNTQCLDNTLRFLSRISRCQRYWWQGTPTHSLNSMQMQLSLFYGLLLFFFFYISISLVQDNNYKFFKNTPVSGVDAKNFSLHLINRRRIMIEEKKMNCTDKKPKFLIICTLYSQYEENRPHKDQSN